MKDRQVVKFLIAGSCTALVEYVCFLILSKFNTSLIAAQCISFSLGLIVSFNFNRSWVFLSSKKSKKEWVYQLSGYISLAIINLILSTVLILWFVDSLHIDDWISKFVIMVMIATWNFFIFKKILFRDDKKI